MMTSFEQACSDTEKAAAATLKSAKNFVKVLNALQKAAREGNIGTLRKNAEKLEGDLVSLGQEVANAVGSWPFQHEEEEAYLREHYAAELRDKTAEMGLDIHERDGLLISHPSIVRVLPGNRAVRVDKKLVSTLRPSHLAGILEANQKKQPRFKSAAFLKAMYERYLVLAKAEPPRLDRQGPVVPLAEIYEAFTSLPGSKNEYGRTDFARDLYFLERDGPVETRTGASVSFPAAAGTRSPRGTFPFVGPDGQVITYYGIRFSGGE